ncbi:beta-catenin-like protein 1 isoform X2 [Microplitis mediator]|uniref:beta-catenin-like protein 1 isoform X2 n=1 Tax=Microplitis mediator TaxID=375433 RepID=UPI002555E348|nr:beta-catenin-like protein 1 isoform X2 [Microplitis mediator]
MDVGELLSYKPPSTTKRTHADDNDDDDDWDNGKKKKINKTPYHPRQSYTREVELTPVRSQPEPPTPTRNSSSRTGSESTANDIVEPELTDKQKAEILKLVEADTPEVEALDEANLKRMVLLFEKRAFRNQEMRVKFPDQPEKFMESEVELHETLQELHVVATNPELYPLMVELRAIPSLLELLSHENTDIAVGVVDLLQELTDVDILHESQDGADALIDALLDQQVSALLVQNLDRLDETVKEESDGVFNTLAIFENLLEFRPELCVDAGKQGLLQWLLRRLKAKLPFDTNKFLMETVNRDRFLRGEGLQLMNLMLREKKLSRNGSLKVLDHAMNGPDGKDNCTKFVDILGLRTIFPLFMKTPSKNRKKVFTAEEHEEHVVSIIASMLRNCKGQQRQRLLSKFTENDFEKVDRLMELHFKYLEKVEEIENNAKEDDDEEESYIKRLDGGLFTLQLVDYVLLEACAGCPPAVKQRVTRILSQRRASLKTIRHIMREYAGNLGEAGDAEWREAEQQRILQLIDKF